MSRKRSRHGDLRYRAWHLSLCFACYFTELIPSSTTYDHELCGESAARQIEGRGWGWLEGWGKGTELDAAMKEVKLKRSDWPCHFDGMKKGLPPTALFPPALHP